MRKKQIEDTEDRFILIRIRKSTKDMLAACGHKGQTWDEVIRQIIEAKK